MTSPCRPLPLDRLVVGLVKSMALQYLLLGRLPIQQTLEPEAGLREIDQFKMAHTPRSQQIRTLKGQRLKEALQPCL
jgi:hypothetical protein